MDEKGLVIKRSKRCMATILGFKEKHCDAFLPEDISENLRKVILDEVNELINLVTDILDEDVVFNEEYFTMLEDIHDILIPKE